MYSARLVSADSSSMRTLLSMLDPECFQDRRFPAKSLVAARREPLAELPDALKAVPSVGVGVLLIVVLAGIGKVAAEDGMELVAPTGNVPARRRGRDRDRRAHMNVYGRNLLLASGRGPAHCAAHGMAHSPDAFSSLRSCEGAGDARRWSPD